MRKTLLYDEVVSFKTAVLAKTAGFDADCTLCYCDFEGQVIISPDPCSKLCKIICMAPTQSLLQRWLREEKGLHISIPLHKGEYKYFWAIDRLNRKKKVDNIAYNLFDTYELALEDALKYALKNLGLL